MKLAIVPTLTAVLAQSAAAYPIARSTDAPPMCGSSLGITDTATIIDGEKLPCNDYCKQNGYSNGINQQLGSTMTCDCTREDGSTTTVCTIGSCSDGGFSCTSSSSALSLMLPGAVILTSWVMTMCF